MKGFLELVFGLHVVSCWFYLSGARFQSYHKIHHARQHGASLSQSEPTSIDTNTSLIDTRENLAGTLVSPHQDTFYKPPQGYENEEPGTILKTRRIEKDHITSLHSLVQNIEDAYQFLYRTNDGLNQATVSVTTLLIPHNADRKKIVSQQLSDDATDIECSPSYALRLGSKDKANITQEEVLGSDTFMGRGYMVLVPDYEGIGCYNAVGKMSGFAILDSIRAALQSGQVDPNAQVQLYGYSGGAVSSSWALQMMSKYAPELNIIGAAVGGIAANPSDIFETVNETPSAGIIATAIMSYSKQYPDFGRLFNDSLLPEYHDLFYTGINNNCYPKVNALFNMSDINTFFNVRNFNDNPLLQRLIRENTLGGESPTVPMLVYHGGRDSIATFNQTEALVNRWCEQGSDIEFLNVQESEHLELGYFGMVYALEYIDSRFNGISNNNNHHHLSGCTRRTSPSPLLDPDYTILLGRWAFEQMFGVFHFSVGPRNSTLSKYTVRQFVP